MSVTLSKLVTPGLFVLHERVIQPRYLKPDNSEADAIDEQGIAIIAGIGRLGQIAQCLLRANGITTVVMDHSLA